MTTLVRNVIDHTAQRFEPIMLATQEEKFDPHTFFTYRNDQVRLRALHPFPSYVLRAASLVSSGPAARLSVYELARSAYDREIMAELPQDPLVELWQIAELMRRQPQGQDGILLNNGYANIFYVNGVHGRVFAVGVRWYNDEWRVLAWKLDEGACWGAGCRVFSST